MQTMPTFSTALLVLRVAMKAAAVLGPKDKALADPNREQITTSDDLSPEEEEAELVYGTLYFIRFLLAANGVTAWPEAGVGGWSLEYMKRMIGLHNKRMQELLHRPIIFEPSGSKIGEYLLFDFGRSDLSNFDKALLRFSNSLTVDVSAAVRMWNEYPSGVLRIDCEVPQCISAKLEITFLNSSQERLVCNGDCCRKPLRINFEDIGWTNVVMPKVFDAHYCEGTCNSMNMSASNHALLQNIVREKGLADAPGPCCAPKEMRPLPYLFHDEVGNLTHGILPNAIVDSCGCS